MPSTRLVMWSSVALVGAAACGLLLGACQGRSAAPSSDVLAEVNGVPITADEIDRALAQPLAQLEDQTYGLRRRQLDVVIDDRLIAAEAARRGASVSELMDQEVTPNVQVTEAEVGAAVDANRSRWTGTEEALREAIRTDLERQALAVARQAFVESLEASAHVVISLPLPPAYRLEVPLDGAAATRGPADAPVTIVEFTDFHCPFCRAAQPTVAEIERRYGRFVRFVQHDMPIDQLHPQARAVHEAARCAGDQDRFWEYRERAFAEAPIPLGRLADIAEDVGLDIAAFETCRAGPEVRRAVADGVQLASRLGLTSTPTFFINNRLVVGARPFDEFIPFIEEELRRARVPFD